MGGRNKVSKKKHNQAEKQIAYSSNLFVPKTKQNKTKNSSPPLSRQNWKEIKMEVEEGR